MSLTWHLRNNLDNDDGHFLQRRFSNTKSMNPIWLCHLVGCVLLDNEDQYHIHLVGINMVHHERLVSWPLDEFLERLSGKSTINLASQRQEFHTYCENLPISW
jgi:hypothetical protein